ncbi:uroporphyrinogen-III C-methyltransferase [Telmatospirillum sp. J64-1]|uniref:uroporphyrinogen-III C-methyltransferase n=1 Tax=Telmatospirillum sp. J64-1 TaxID=2502183 RepID=UPI00115DDA33|nr:uroporphyrinogen-III C-methyltransferase [Telmatospirillum sp. J64-1]
MDSFPIEMPEFRPGSVWLVGAGPGDPGLLSLLALHALRHADVVVYDALVDERILALVHPEAVLEYAGKRGGKPSAKQPDISKRLVVLAQEGKRVLRLKGGDPFVFGRGAEEALTLVGADVPFRVVPGITSGVGALAYAGIPATSRDTNSAIAFVTGHSATGDVPDGLDWTALARLPALVLYMALKHAGPISQRLIAAGRDADTPAAVVSRGTTPHQKVLETTLGRLEADIAASGIEPPALLVIGEMVRLRSLLDWQGGGAMVFGEV